MKILHTADWHLGCKTDDLDRLDEQKDALRQVINIANEQNVDMVLIAGDIYDTLIPSGECEKLFYDTAVELSNNGNRAVIAIAGNHDEPKRMSNANVFADRFNIYFVGYIDEIKAEYADKTKNIYPTNCGKGFISFKTKAGENVNVACLPYPSYYRYRELKSENKNINDKVKEWLSYGTSSFSKDAINITLAHLLTYSAKLDTETVDAISLASDISTFIDRDILKTNATYTALGHLHSAITVSTPNNIYYSGSLINQFFAGGDCATSVIVADLDKNGIKSFDRIPLNVKLLDKYEVESVAEGENVLKHLPDYYIKLIIKNVDYISSDEIKRLRSSYKNLITLSVITKNATGQTNVISKKDLTNAEIFDNFVITKTGEPPKQSVKELFLSLMSEDLYETD